MPKVLRSKLSGRLITPQQIHEEYREYLRERRRRYLEHKVGMSKEESDKRLAEHVYQTGKLFERIGDHDTAPDGTPRYILRGRQ